MSAGPQECPHPNHGRAAVFLGILGLLCAILPLLAPGAIALGSIAVALGIGARRRAGRGTASSGWAIALGAIAVAGGVAWVIVFWVLSDAFNGF